jgi:hypothetical protein
MMFLAYCFCTYLKYAKIGNVITFTAMYWKKQLQYDPIPSLLECGYENIIYFVKRDLLDKKVGDIGKLWEMNGAVKILRKQQPDGRWKYPNPKEDLRETEGYDQIETLRQLGFLVEHYGFDKQHPAIKKAKKFIFRHQTEAGDIRGIYWHQYSPNYTANFLELFIKAGYAEDPQIKKAQNWLLSVRQHDGGWVIPVRTHKKKLKDWMILKSPLEPDRTKPFSYMATGVVLRGFAYDPSYRDNKDIVHATELVLSRLFQKDIYPDRNKPEAWIRFSFPFWFTDLIAILDPVFHLGFKSDHPKVKEGLSWFVKNQKKDGTWKLYMLKGEKLQQPYWMDLNVCRLFRKFYG